MVTNGPAARGLQAWICRASTVFPVPLSPVSSTTASLRAARSAVSRARCMAGLADVSSSGLAGGAAEAAVLAPQALDLERAVQHERDLVETEGLHEVVVRARRGSPRRLGRPSRTPS